MAAPRAALFCRSYLPFSETFIHDELRHHERWRVDVICRALENRERFPHPDVFVPGAFGRLAYRATTYAPSITRHLRAGGHRLIHAHFGTNAVHAHLFARRLRLPLVITFHGFDVGVLLGPPSRSPWLLRYRALAPSLLARADAMLCASVELQEQVARLSGRPDATRLYRLGIDLTRFVPASPSRTCPRVVMIGRFVAKKGHLDGIEAFAHLIRAGHDARLALVGAGPLEPAYRERIAALRLEDRVEWMGVLSPAEVAALLARSDIVMAPSKQTPDGDRESGVIVLKEASATALPVLGTRHGGIPEIIDDGVTGYLVSEGDVAALATRLEELVANPALRLRLGAAGRAKMEREYDVRERVAELETIYDQLAG